MIANITGTLQVPRFQTNTAGRSTIDVHEPRPGRCRVQIKGSKVLYRFTDYDVTLADCAEVVRAGRLSVDDTTAYRRQASDGRRQRTLIFYGDHGALLRLNITDGGNRLFIYAKAPFQDYGDGSMLDIDSKSLAAFDRLWKLFKQE